VAADKGEHGSANHYWVNLQNSFEAEHDDEDDLFKTCEASQKTLNAER
jgi:hypothetical protein